MKRASAVALTLSIVFPCALIAQSSVPPWDLWNDSVRAAIRDRTTLELEVTQPSLGFGVYSSELYFTSNSSASWFDATPPYDEHVGEKIRIHGYIAWPLAGGPYPAILIGHGHGGSADAQLTQLVATLGYVALYIDGPRAGGSTGGPQDDNQAWISVDKGPEYGYLYHYAYAGMRALTALEALAAQAGNPYRIDTSRLGVLGASMGGIFTTYINAVDDRVKAAVAMASAGNWLHTLRYENSWLYEGIYNGTRDRPYNGSDPLNSIEDIDTDPTAITFTNYFDPIRYATRQHAPLLILIGTHDEYFPMPSANLMLQAVTSSGANPLFEKRLWLYPNAPHAFADATTDLIALVPGLSSWLNYCFGSRERPLETPRVTLASEASGLRFEITTGDPASRLGSATATLYAATRVNSVVRPIRDFGTYIAVREGDRFVAVIPPGSQSASGESYTAENVLYFATVVESGLPISSLMYKGAAPIDLSSGFVPVIESRSATAVPLPPPYSDAAVTVSSSLPVATDRAYQGMSLANPGANPVAVRIEARNADGRILGAEGLMNPVVISLPPKTQKIFLAEEWLGPGARNISGSFRAGWSDAAATSLAFRGNIDPPELEGIGPSATAAAGVWLPLAPEQDASAPRRIRIFAPGGAAAVKVTFRDSAGNTIDVRDIAVAAGGTVDLTPPAAASAAVESTVPVSARLEVTPGGDPWSLEGRRMPSGTRYIQPHTEWNGTFRTRLLIVNPVNERRNVTVFLRTPDGAGAGVSTVVLEGNATVSRTVEDLFGIAPAAAAGAGWIEIDSEGGPTVVTALAIDSTRGAAAGSAVEEAAGTAWSLPFFVENEGYWTGLAISNSGNDASGVSLIAYDPAGNVLGQHRVTVEAGQSSTLLVGQWIEELAGGGTGQIVVAATAPVRLLAYFGTDDGGSLAAIPVSEIGN